MFLSSVALRAVTPRIVVVVVEAAVVEAVVVAAEVAAVAVAVAVEAALAVAVVEAAVVAADIAAVEAAAVGKHSCRLYFAKSINQQAGEAITICPCQKYGTGVIAFSLPMVGFSFFASNPALFTRSAWKNPL